MSEQNKQLVRRFFEQIDTGEPAILDEFVAQGYRRQDRRALVDDRRLRSLRPARRRAAAGCWLERQPYQPTPLRHGAPT